MKIKIFLLECLDALKYSLLIIFILFFTLWPLKVEGFSMYPTFSSGDRIVMSRIMVYLNLLNRGDIVISRVYNYGSKHNIIKRIIAIPGDNIVIKNGNVYVNGQLLYEPYSLNQNTYGDMNIFLQKDQYFLMGDNRPISTDSRDFGLIYKNQISGKVLIRWFPFTRLKLL